MCTSQWLGQQAKSAKFEVWSITRTNQRCSKVLSSGHCAVMRLVKISGAKSSIAKKMLVFFTLTSHPRTM